MTDEDKVVKFYAWCKNIDEVEQARLELEKQEKERWKEAMEVFQLYRPDCPWLEEGQ